VANLENFSDRLRPAATLYVDVYPYVVDASGRAHFLLLKRHADVELAGSWQQVSGKIAKGERIREAFIRQVKIKTGQTPLELYKLDFVNTFYDDFYDAVMFVPTAACRLASDAVIVSEYHSEHRWVTAEESRLFLEWPNQVLCIETISAQLSRGGFGKFYVLPIGSR